MKIVKKVKMHISLSSVCKHTNKFRDIKLNIFSWLSRGGGGEIVGEILGGMKGNFGYNEISEFPIFLSLIVNQPLDGKLYDWYNYKLWHRKVK